MYWILKDLLAMLFGVLFGITLIGIATFAGCYLVGKIQY